MKTINLSGSDTDVVDPNKPPPGPNPAPPNAGTLAGTVTEEEALNASKHTKISTLIGIPGTSGSTSVPGGTQSVSVGGMVDPKLAVNLMDAVLPSLLVLLLFKLGVKLRKSELQLTEKEKDTIAPILNKCLDTLMIHFDNPWTALIVTLITIYGSKVGEKFGVAMLEKKVKEQEDGEAGKPSDPSKVADPGKPEWLPSEALVKNRMDTKKYSRKRAIEILKSMHKAGKIDDYGNAIKTPIK